MAQIILPTGAVPATPTAGNVTVYAKTDGFIYGKDSAGVETPLSAMPVGSVIQVVNAIYGTQVATSTGDFSVATGLTASITPKFASSKILVLVSQNGCGKDTGATALKLRLMRNSTQLAVFESTAGRTGTTASNYIGGSSICYSDSPSTTSATTYRTDMASSDSIQWVYTQLPASLSTITLMEIKQ